MGGKTSINISNEEGINFVFNKKSLTASISLSPNAHGEILLPRSIQYNSQEYIIKSIEPCSFKNNKQLKSIEFSQDSELDSIGKEAFTNSSIESIAIPSQVKEIKESTFYECNNLKTVKFTENSQLSLIENHSFASTAIEKVSLPIQINEIGEFSFYSCKNLKEIKMDKNSTNLKIGKFAFAFSSIQKISMPSSIEKFDDEWCRCTKYLNEILIPSDNKNFSYLDKDKKLIASKSEKNKNLFDVIIFASRDIEKVLIPSQIKYINSFSFDSCKNIKTIEFENYSNLEFINN